MTQQAGAARIRLLAECQLDIETIPGQQSTQSFRPFDEDDAIGHGILETKLKRIARFFDAIQIEMPDRDLGKCNY